MKKTLSPTGRRPVRAYDAFIETLDLEDLGIEINLHKVGHRPGGQC